MTKELKDLLRQARSVPMTPEDREVQRRSFVYGNTAFENDRITRELVDRVAERLKQVNKNNGT